MTNSNYKTAPAVSGNGSSKSDLEIKQAFLSAIVESSNDAIIGMDMQGIITSWNKAAERVFGYAVEEVLGKPVTILIPNARQDEEEDILKQIRQGVKVAHFQTVRIGKSGREIPISLTVSPVRDLSGRIIGASKISRDISAELEAQQAMQDLLQEVKTANVRKNEFIALASHELKTPLTAVSGYLQVIENKSEDGLVQKFITKALKQVEKLNNLVTELLDISRIEAGKLEFSMETFDLRELISDVIDTYRLTFTTHELIFEGPAHAVPLHADRQRIEQVLINLLSNAVKYSLLSQQVLVRLEEMENSAVVTVIDQGIGLTEEQQEKVFDRFYRADEVSKITGLGLGLYLSKEIIKRHNGEIGVRSNPGEGSDFYFIIPLRP